MFYEISQEGPWIWGLFAFGAISFFFMLAQRNSLLLFAEIAHCVWSIFVSPFLYLRKTILEVALGDANPRHQSVDHYLLRRVLTALQVLLLLSIFLGAGLAAASAFIAYLPPIYLRQELAATSDRLAKIEASLKQDADAVRTQDSDWNNRRQELIRQAHQEGLEKKAGAQAALQADVSAVRSQEGVELLNTIRTFLATRGTEYGIVDQAKSYVNRMPISESETKSLISYCDDWQALESLSSRAPKTLDQVRSEVQPDHATLVQSVSDGTTQVSELAVKVSQLQKQMDNGYHPDRFLLRLVYFFFFFILWVWVIGTAIETFAMALYLSNDVKQIRTQGEEKSLLQLI